jgi:hypothetical protein
MEERRLSVTNWERSTEGRSRMLTVGGKDELMNRFK